MIDEKKLNRGWMIVLWGMVAGFIFALAAGDYGAYLLAFKLGFFQ